jgi:hypothetical protein
MVPVSARPDLPRECRLTGRYSEVTRSPDDPSLFVVDLSAMPPQIQTFTSFQEADEADARYYAGLSPQERLDIVLELADRYWRKGEDSQRLARVYRVVERQRG